MEHNDTSQDEAPEAAAGQHPGGEPSELSPAERYVEQVRRTNARILGQLVLHYRSRDVTITVDGASAMRILSTWQQRPCRPPRVDPQWSSAKWTWLGIDLDELMGMLWLPDDELGSSGNPERVTVDPRA